MATKNMNTKFERWVSLGNFCLTKFQINRHIIYHHLGFRENLAESVHDYATKIRPFPHHINGGNHFFDWVVIDDFATVINEFSTGFDYRLALADLMEVLDEDGNITSISCKKLGLLWHHLFPREGDYVIGNWKQHFDAATNKVDHLRSKFLDLKHYKTLYIATMSFDEISRGIPDALHSVLAQLRGNEDFALLAVSEAPKLDKEKKRPEPGRAGVYLRYFEPILDDPLKPWYGNSAGWDSILSEFELALPLNINLPSPPSHQLPQDILPHFEGRVDKVVNGNIVGWLFNKKAPYYAFTVELLDGDKVVASTRANLQLADKAEAKRTPEYYWFELPVPKTVIDGQMHGLHVRVEGTLYELAGSPLVFGFGTTNPLVKEVFNLRKEISHLRGQVEALSAKSPAILQPKSPGLSEVRAESPGPSPKIIKATVKNQPS